MLFVFNYCSHQWVIDISYYPPPPKKKKKKKLSSVSIFSENLTVFSLVLKVIVESFKSVILEAM